jgi:hypothetical protein
MYCLEDKLKKKYGDSFGFFAPEFLDRVRELDEIRKRRCRIQEYPAGTEPVGKHASPLRLYYLIDASAVIHLYVPDEQVTPKLDHLIEQRGLGKAFLLIPNFCVAETFNALARLHYRKKELNADLYQFCKRTFGSDIHNGQFFYHYEMNRYHILDVDHIIPFEHLFLTERPKGAKKGEDWSLSTYDVLIIAMGMELDRITGGAAHLVTCDRRMDAIGKILLHLTREQRDKYHVPNFVQFPRTINLWKTDIDELPFVEGQRVG